MTSPPKTLPPLPPPLSMAKSKMVTYFLLLISAFQSSLMSFQMIILPFSYADKRGWDSAHPAFSCKEILDSGHSKGDGEYWIDPEKSGNPLKVYCDMSRSGGKRMNFFFWDTRTSTEVYLTWSSCYWNVLVLAIFAFSRNILIMIGYHQPADLSTTRQCTRHTCYWTV